MAEVQAHGFAFEQRLRDIFFEGYSGTYTAEWDVPPSHNRHEAVPRALRNLPVSVKVAKYGTPIGLGDVNRQRAISGEFVMVVGFWKQRTATEKWIEDIGVAHLTPERWANLWGCLSSEELLKIDALVKDLSITPQAARIAAKEWKLNVSALTNCAFVINPKIDTKRQRRIQCSLPFRIFWDVVGREPLVQDSPAVFGLAFENPISSRSHVFNPKPIR